MMLLRQGPRHNLWNAGLSAEGCSESLRIPTREESSAGASPPHFVPQLLLGSAKGLPTSQSIDPHSFVF